MRYVDIDCITLPDGWLDKCQEATLAVLEKNEDPNDHCDVWKELKPQLAALLGNKCWFCETPIPRSDNAVDHFRPKGRVSDATSTHGGYRWLAFEKSNFRYACTFCNSKRIDVVHGTAGGKADRFPLLNEASRVYAVDPASLDFDDLLDTISAESAMLLDPCELEDWKLLGCKRENGHSCPAPASASDTARVERSIDVYHLNHEPTTKQRHALAVLLLEYVREAKKLFLGSASSLTAAQEFRRVARRIVRMIDRKAPYSGEMIFLLRGQRAPEHPWVQQLIET
jgi:hypothetical protein